MGNVAPDVVFVVERFKNKSMLLYAMDFQVLKLASDLIMLDLVRASQ